MRLPCTTATTAPRCAAAAAPRPSRREPARPRRPSSPAGPWPARSASPASRSPAPAAAGRPAPPRSRGGSGRWTRRPRPPPTGGRPGEVRLPPARPRSFAAPHPQHCRFAIIRQAARWHLATTCQRRALSARRPCRRSRLAPAGRLSGCRRDLWACVCSTTLSRRRSIPVATVGQSSRQSRADQKSNVPRRETTLRIPAWLAPLL